MTDPQGKVYYGMHMEPGLAEYREPDGEPYRILVGEEIVKSMNPSFSGKPVFVDHVDTIDIENLHEKADGWVVESFFNTVDGKTWVKFIAVTDKAKQAIRNGWRLSNAYIPKEWGAPGIWHGMDYHKEVMRADYEHLAIVQNPRYEESVIMTPDQFKEYNQKKELELAKVANSNDKEKTVLSIFKKQKVENAIDMESMSIVLPKSKREMTISQIVNVVDDFVQTEGAPQMANDDHMVDMGEEKMNVAQMKEKFNAMKCELDEMKKKNAELDGGEKQAAKEDDAAVDKTKKNEDGAEEVKKEVAAEEKEVKKNNFEKLKNAPHEVKQTVNRELHVDKLARGKSRYGSNK